MEPPNANKLGILSTVSYSNLFLCSFFLSAQVLLLALQHRHQPHDRTDLHHALHRCFPRFHISGGP